MSDLRSFPAGRWLGDDQMSDLDLVTLGGPMLRQHLGNQAAMTFFRLCLRA
jgi:hypothetical protein